VANNVTDLLSRKNYLQKIKKMRKQVKKLMVKQATMGILTYFTTKLFYSICSLCLKKDRHQVQIFKQMIGKKF